MAGRMLSAAERALLTSWPEITHADLAAHFDLSIEDLRWLRSIRAPGKLRLALALQYCALQFLGYLPTDPAATPQAVVDRLARQLAVSPAALQQYEADAAERSQRRHDELVIARARWRVCGRGEWKALRDWLLARALEHDDPAVLFRQALDWLRSERIARPGTPRACGRDRPGRRRRGDPAPARTDPDH
jgi:hypothetical protein